MREEPKLIKKHFILACSLVILMLTMGIIVTCIKNFNTDVNYNRNVHSYMENAYYASTPELMIDQLEMAVKGMHKLGLTDNMYDTLLPWKQLPDHQMKYEYQHMQAIIDRANDVVAWREEQSHAQGGSQLGDVYGQKVDALRNFMKNDGGWSDKLAYAAYYVNKVTPIAMYNTFAGFLIYLPLIIATIISVAIGVRANFKSINI